MVESAGLLNPWPLTGPAGSNPVLSANDSANTRRNWPKALGSKGFGRFLCRVTNDGGCRLRLELRQICAAFCAAFFVGLEVEGQ